LENVANLIFGNAGGWFRYCMGEIAKIGYDAEWHVIRASDFGFPHRRNRIFIIAHTNGVRSNANYVQKTINIEEFNQWAPNGNGLYTDIAGFRIRNIAPHLREYDGIPQGLDLIRGRIKCLGNSLVPQIAEFIGNQIMEIDHE